MSVPHSNQEIYNGLEFATWIDRETLLAEESHLIHKYLHPQLRTVEAGTNGGRIVFQLQKLGFSSLAGFDYVPKLIDVAIARDVKRAIEFTVQDAISLAYPDSSCDQIIYLQQIICLIENAADRLSAVREAYRILKPGGTGLFSVLSFESRCSKPIYAAYLNYLTAIRKLRGEDRSIQYLPWLILGGKFNLNAIVDRAPYVYWYTVTEICQLLRSVGFEIAAVGSARQISEDNLKISAADLLASELDGMVYVVVKK